MLCGGRPRVTAPPWPIGGVSQRSPSILLKGAAFIPPGSRVDPQTIRTPLTSHQGRDEGMRYQPSAHSAHQSLPQHPNRHSTLRDPHGPLDPGQDRAPTPSGQYPADPPALSQQPTTEPQEDTRAEKREEGEAGKC
ncbi:uncharacterized protein LOC130912304 isoform X2 [Corythoichthys intestinalis]|uniref:uncharacterized protein LOC130912304 isoform X2 n=1 Tax=Corythoichthys intestinalis TaxID=161448 RepID=UPI0025A658A4|nr:uncharacterized protein LOC130912304 isoform X2 [Corythoichthys intestinalis]